MKSRTLAQVALALLLIIGSYRIARALVGSAGAARSRSAAAEEIRIHEADIAFYLERAARDPRGAADRVNLAGLYLQHARETGTFEDYQRAEAYARASLGMRHAHNARAFSLLASALLAQHRFDEARQAAESLVSWEPWLPGHRAMLAEIASEMGRYDQARTQFDSLRTDASRLDVAPRLARWAELNGRVDEARLLLANAFIDAKRLAHLPREQVAWYALRLGDLESRAGRPHLAERLYREGLEFFPGDYRLCAALARLMLELGDPREAVRFGDQALATVLEPGTLGVLADAHAALGDSARASQYVHVMEVALSGQTGPLHRQWELFLLDHGRSVDLVAQRAREELASRRDVYGYDVLAWALYKQGRVVEARATLDSAPRLGSSDPLLARHRVAIEGALSATLKATVR